MLFVDSPLFSHSCLLPQLQKMHQAGAKRRRVESKQSPEVKTTHTYLTLAHSVISFSSMLAWKAKHDEIVDNDRLNIENDREIEELERRNKELKALVSEYIENEEKDREIEELERRNKELEALVSEHHKVFASRVSYH